MLFSAALLFMPPFSVAFGVIYLLCGLSDVADGIVARQTHTESELGAKLDSAADMLFLTAGAVKILPNVHLAAWIWVWAAVIAAIKITGMLLRLIQGRTVMPPHSFSNKLTGLLLFIFPMTVLLANSCFFAATVCAVASLGAVQDIRRRTV